MTNLRVWLEGVEQNGKVAIIVKKVRKEDNEMWFKFNEEMQQRKHHAQLFELSVIKNNIKGIEKVGQKRRVQFKATEELANIYIDADSGIFKFNSEFLEEDDEDERGNFTQNIDQRDLIDLIRVLTKRMDKEDQDTRKLNIQKYDGKEDASLFLLQFQSEANKLNYDDNKKIEILGNYVSGIAHKWYLSCLKKFQNQDWAVWRKSFMAVFGIKNWSSIANAFQYKYIKGSLIDYAITKEKMLRDTNEGIDDTTVINQIMINTPSYVQEQIKPGEIDDLNTLYEALSKIKVRTFFKDYSQEFQCHNNNTTYAPTKTNQIKYTANQKPGIKKPCSICVSLGFKERYHPEDLCRNKQKAKNVIKSNLIERNTSEEISSDEEDTQKN